MDNRIYRIWLQHALGPGNTKVRRILKYYKTIEDFCKKGFREWSSFGIFTERELYALRDFSADNAASQIEYCEKLGEKIYTPESPEYPACLKNINNPPGVLYVKGTLPDFDKSLSVTIVGSRKASDSGIKTAFRLGRDIASKGAVIVSGGAIGVDISAHKGALAAGGITVCIMACGINYPYLIQNASIREEIAEKGALISEYPPDTGLDKGNFQIRNRILSGLSAGVVIVESSIKSGTMITAKYALEQGKDVFAVPGDVNNPVASGVNNMIQDGAKLVTNAADILSEYNLSEYKDARAAEIIKENEPSDIAPCGADEKTLSGDELLIYNILKDTPIYIGDIETELGFSPGRILTALTELELSGKAVSCSGRRYMRSGTVNI